MRAAQTKERITFKNILFATDFSPAADVAAPFAIQIARSYGAKVCGLHVNAMNDYMAAAPEAWAAMSEAMERENREDKQRLERQLEGIEHEAVIGLGNPWEAVANSIREKEIDLVVVGTRGRTGLGKALLGSIAEQILRHAPCPVLTVGPHCVSEPPKAAGTKEILYATDLTAEFPAAAPCAISLAQENQAHLILLHVIEDPKVGELVQPWELVDSKVRKLRALVPPEAELWCQPKCLVVRGEPAAMILHVATEMRADLIVLGARGARGITTHLDIGTVHKVVTQAKCPVLTVDG